MASSGGIVIQLSFQAALDPFHTVFRLLRLRPVVAEVGPLHTDWLRVLDFYLLFPFRISAIRLTRPHQHYKRLAQKYDWTRPYGAHPEDRVLFENMRPLQSLAMDTLATHALLDPEQLSLSRAMVSHGHVPDAISSRISIANQKDSDLIAFLTDIATHYEIGGPDGLRARTGLIEHRYDAI